MPPEEFDFGATTDYFKDIRAARPDELAAAATYQWNSGYVDNGEVDGHPISLALEFRGNLNIPHLAYRTASVNESQLKHTYWAPPNWIRETVLSSVQVGGARGVGYAASIAIDRFGGPHIAFVRANTDGTYTVQYVRRQGSGWNVDQVQAGLRVFPSRTGIALDPGGVPHIAYSNAARGGTIQHAVLINGLWKREIISTGVGEADFPAIDIAHTGAPHISYYSESDRAIRSARLEGLNWNEDTIASPAGEKSRHSATAIDFDSNDAPHICYYATGEDSGLGHARLSGDTWQHDIVDSSDSAGFADIAIDQNNIPRISYIDQGSLRYAERGNGTWDSVTVEPSNCRFTSLAIDLSGRPYIAYYDPQQAYAMLAIGQ